MFYVSRSWAYEDLVKEFWTQLGIRFRASEG